MTHQSPTNHLTIASENVTAMIFFHVVFFYRSFSTFHLFVLVSFGDYFVDKSEVTTLMHVGNDGPAFKDVVKFVNHSGVLVVERG